ncbi:hypothetical protein PFJ02_15040 [Mycobacterium xenopi]|uniref:hypothetical protein n=1 Tax=Mycobacterium xenopi TaxID=1789 RepID=UPI0022EB7A65|nr:hypothetical protein [Mycobacterium xenopi]MDA3663339.1 hypothetical protein [Mycobacterium xenopi]
MGTAVWLAAWGVLIGADSVIMPSHSSVARPAPAVVASTSGGDHPSFGVDHSHVGKGLSGEHPEQFTTAVLPRSGTAVAALAALGVVLAVAVAVAGGLAWFGVPAGRGPPRAPAFSVTGQDVLTRFCLSRR